MQFRLPALLVAAGLSIGLAESSPQVRYERALRASMSPYYAALLVSARGDVDGTQRQVILFAARWADAVKVARTEAPEPLGNDPAWQKALDGVSGAIERARRRAARRDADGAHVELESIRLMLRDVRARHNVLTIDDRFSDFHESMERLGSRVPPAHEFRLRPKDYEVLKEDLAHVKEHWLALGTASVEFGSLAGWKDAATGMESALAEMTSAVERQNGDAVRLAAEAIHARYFDLLRALAEM